MNSGVSIIYNGIDLFNPQPVPFLSLDEKNIYYSEIWAKEETLTMEGQLTGCTFELVSDAQNTLLNKLSKSYQNLEIWQYKNGASGKVFQKDLVEIKSIEFQQSRWIGVLPYTLTFSCYPSGYFSGVFGILEPSDKWEYSEKDNLTLDITHTVSCKGFNTSSTQTNALQNAKNWVYGKTGITSSTPAPNFVFNSATPTFLLLSLNENIDRINGSYSVTEKYTNDLTRSGYGLIRYTTSISSGNNILTVNLDGTIEGGGRDINRARQSFNNQNPFGMAAFSYLNLFRANDLNPTALSQNITEDAYNAKINFSYIYNNDNSPDIVFDYTVKVVSGNNITTEIDGNIITRGGDLTLRFNRAKAYAQTVNLYDLAVPFYNDFYPYAVQAPLNPKPLTSGVSYSPSNGSVSLNATFSNQEQVSNGLDYFEFTMEFNPAIEKLDMKPKLDGAQKAPIDLYSIVDLNYKNRASFTINGNSIINSATSINDGIQLIKQKCMALMFQYVNISSVVLDQNNISFDRTDQRQVSFSFTWSFDSNFIVAVNPYSSIRTLAVK